MVAKHRLQAHIYFFPFFKPTSRNKEVELSMLESLAAGLLNRFLGSYVENFDPTQLNVGIWSGDVKLRNLKLRKESLDALNLPIDVNFGFLGELTLVVPWSSLKNKPVKILINDVYLLCAPRDDSSYDPKEQEERELRLKLQKLAELELMNKSKPTTGNDSAKNESFTQSLITKIVDNLQVTIQNIHIRYEDMESVFSEVPYSVGATLSELSAISTDGDWKPSFISITNAITHKLLTLDSLCAYWNTDTKSIFHEDQEELFIRLKESIADKNGVPDHQFLLRPVSGSGRLTLNKTGSTNTQPHVDAQLFFEEFGFDLDDCQYKDILYTVSKLHWYQKTLKYKKLRPEYSVNQNPKGWFEYAARCVLQEIHDKNYKWSWDFIKAKREKRNKYVELWKKKLALPNVEQRLTDEEDEEALEELHKELSFEDIKIFRAYARKDYMKERLVSKNSTPEPTNSANGGGNGWFSSWWGGNTASKTEEDDLLMTEEQKKELYAAIEFDENKQLIDTINVPKDMVTMKISSMLNRGSFVIKNRNKNLRLGEIVFENCEAEFYQRPDSFLAKFKLHEFKIEDGSPHTLYKHIISVKNLRMNNDGDTPELKEPFFQVSFENNPIDESADSAIDVKLRSMTVFYHVHFINEVIRFFSPPKRHLDTVGAIMNAAEATVEGWSTQTRMGIEAILEDHKTVNLNLDLQAPLLIIPLNPHIWDTPCAIVDAGHISISSDLVPKEKLKEMKNLSPEEYEKIDTKELRRLMFDRFQLHLNDTQFLIGPDIRSTISNLHLNERDNSFTVLDRIELDFTVDVLILPKALNLPKIRTSGKLPRLRLSLNDYQYKIIMELIDKCIPNFEPFDGDEGTEGEFSYFGENNNYQDLERKNDVAVLRQTLKKLEKMSEVELSQRIFELKFEVESVQLSLFKCIDGATMESSKLVDLVGDKLYLKFAKMAKEMDVELALHSLNLDDFIEQSNSDEFKRLITSSDVAADEESNLFQLYYNRTQRIVPYNNTLIEVFDQDIDLEMAELKFVLTPKSILTLMNYALTTFTDPAASEVPSDVLRHNEADVEDAPQKINMSMNLEGIIVVLNDDSIKLATLELSAAEIGLLLMPERMCVTAKLGGLQLTDEVNEGLSRDSVLRKLISMGGDEVVELTYKTFDDANNSNNYNSVLDYKTGSMNINFVDESINRILTYLAKFQKMKVLFDRAREAAYNQAGNIESVNNMKLNVLIKAPVIKFPKLVDPRKGIYDDITFYLGELFVENKFINVGKGCINKIEAGIRSGNLSSLFNMENGFVQKLHIIDNLDLHFKIDHDEKAADDLPSFKIEGYFSPLAANLTELQLRYLYILSQRLSSTFTVDESSLQDVEDAAINANAVIAPNAEYEVTSDIFKKHEEESGGINPNHTQIDFVFEAPDISLTLYNNTEGISSLENHGITRVKLHDFGLTFWMKEDMTLKAETHIAAFTVEDIRKNKDNKHTELIPKIASDSYQFMAALTQTKLNEGDLLNLSMTIDSPKLILAMDYLFALKSFLDTAINVKPSAKISDVPENQNKIDSKLLEDEHREPSKTKFQYCVNVVDSSIILLADPSDTNSEAVVFSAGQLLLADQNILSASANNVGMFLCRMETFNENRVRLLDDFSSSIVIDGRNSTPEKLLTSVQFAIEPLVMRLSLRDIRLAIFIVNRVMALAKENGLVEDTPAETMDINTKYGAFSKEFKKTLSKYAPSVISSLSELSNKRSAPTNEPETILRAEKLHADIEGLRLVLIGDIHELPILDMNIKPFSVSAKDWSSEIDAVASLETYANIFNYSRSSWEPLVESFPISFHLSKGSGQDASLVFDVISRKVAEITLSSRSIALLSQIQNSLYDDTGLKPRGAEKPYKIYNDTGLDLNVWIASKEAKDKRGLTTLKNGEVLPWEFEDWRKVRDSLDTDNSQSILGVQVVGSKYKTTLEIDVTSEGEEVYMLEPAKNQVHNRLACELKLCEDNVKLITLRSTLLLENTTSTTVQFKMNTNDPVTYDIRPGDSRSVPIEEAYSSEILIRPGCEEKYGWSDDVLHWESLLCNPRSIRCNSSSTNSKFYFQVDSKFDTYEPLAKIYPHMKIVISSPLVVENLLPYDLKFELFDKNEKNKGVKCLKKGERMPIQDVRLENFLLLSVQPDDEGFKMSKPAIINTPKNSELRPENKLSLKHDNGQLLYLQLRYRSIEDTRAKLISIYSPYVILNSTGKDLYVEGDKYNITQCKVSLDGELKYSKPRMFSFCREDDNRSRARIRFKDSSWSIPTSFHAIGQSFDLTMEIPHKNQECNVGVHISEGEGKYKYSKVVEIQPRYIVKNCLDIDIEICECSSGSILTISPSTSVPLYKMRNILNKQLMIKFLGSASEWSSPFLIKDIGSNYLKILKPGIGHKLLKLDIVLEKATIFVHITDAKDRWPYSIRNFSDNEFIFYQRDPRMFDDDDDYSMFEENDDMEFEPLYYRVPPKSVMPYAWDYPAARQKKLIITSRGRKREIQLAEIGNLRPMRMPGRTSDEIPAIVDLNVVADGPTQALVISNYNPEFSLYKLRSSQHTSSSISVAKSDKFEVQEEDKNVYTKVVIAFEGVGISLINAKLQELCYINVKGLELRYNESDLYQTVSWKMKWVQIDNQLFGGIYQNIVYPTAIPNTSKEINNHPVLSGSISKVKDDSHGVLYFKHATILLQELNIQLDEDFLVSLIAFTKIPGASWNQDVKDKLCDEIVVLPQPQAIQKSNDMYFEVFHLQPTLLHLSFARTEHLNAEEEKTSGQNTLMFFVNVLTMALGNINDAPIKLNSLFMDNVRVPLPLLLQAVQTHYGQQFFYQIHKILGSADFLGNPVGLFNNISSGVWDIFYEPYQGYIMNDRPQELGISIAKGGLSFVKKSVFGFSDSMARFTGSVAKGLSVATQDSEFQERRRLLQRKTRSKQSFNGFGAGATSFVSGISSGLGGIALDPYKGATKEGATGFLKGLGKGLVGLPTKTAIGVLDLANNVSEGIRNTTTVLDGALTSRARLPRYVGYDQVIKPYNLRESQGQFWLKTANGGECMGDKYLAHVVLPGKELAVIVSMRHIIEVMISKQEIVWKVRYMDISGMVLEKGGLRIVLKNANRSEFFIPIADATERRFLYRHISIAVTEYNKYCEAAL